MHPSASRRNFLAALGGAAAKLGGHEKAAERGRATPLTRRAQDGEGPDWNSFFLKDLRKSGKATWFAMQTSLRMVL